MTVFDGGIILEIYTLTGIPQQYAWGKDSTSSYINHFRKTHSDLPDTGTLAELWFGTHPNGESRVTSINGGKTLPLSGLLKRVSADEALPYLLKILSIQEILSIQLHPDVEQAKKLHALHPDIYPDSSPKPEMAIALTELELICGVRSIEEIKKEVLIHPAFASLFNENAGISTEEINLKKLFSYLLNLDQETLEQFYSIVKKENRSPYDRMVLNAYQYLGSLDAGITLLYFLEHHLISPGEAIFIAPNIPHAYISGDLVECMLCSDNVVRGGLTSKYVATEDFCNNVVTEPYKPLLLPEFSDSGLKRYRPPHCPFFIEVITDDSLTQTFEGKARTEILLTIKGHGVLKSGSTEVRIDEGSTLFLLPDSNGYEISGENLHLFRVIEI